MSEATHHSFVDAEALQPRPAPTPVHPASPLRAARAMGAARQGRDMRLSRLLRRYTRLALVIVLAAMALDVLVRLFWPSPSYWLDLTVLGAITLPVLGVGGQLFVRRALEQERALHWQQARNWLQVRHDPLVWADNRKAFREMVAEINLLPPKEHGALFMLDLHEFQRINNACGHAAGDEVLRQTGRRLRDVMLRHRPLQRTPFLLGRRRLRPRLVRLGSDELACWFPIWPAEQDPTLLAQAMLDSLDEPLRVGSLWLNLRANVGFVVERHGQLQGSEWLTRVNAATLEAKRLGAGQLAPYTAVQLECTVRRHELQQGLQMALPTGEGLQLHYQPIVSTHTYELVGCEALLRWTHKTMGPVSPAEFIPVAEASDLIHALGRWVLNEAMRQLAQWRAEFPHSPMDRFRVSDNLSRAQLLDPGLAVYLHRKLNEYALQPDWLCLEVTESLPLDDPSCVRALQQLSRLGLRLALDDFGTGYSSLSALLNLPLQSVKIDRQFITGIDTCKHRQSLVEAVLRVAQGMSLDVVAEGIERDAEARTLLQLGCHHMQGWHISAAVNAQAFGQRWLLAWRPAAAPTLPLAMAAQCAVERDCELDRFGRCVSPCPPPTSLESRHVPTHENHDPIALVLRSDHRPAVRRVGLGAVGAEGDRG